MAGGITLRLAAGYVVASFSQFSPSCITSPKRYSGHVAGF